MGGLHFSIIADFSPEPTWAQVFANDIVEELSLEQLSTALNFEAEAMTSIDMRQIMQEFNETRMFERFNMSQYREKRLSLTIQCLAYSKMFDFRRQFENILTFSDYFSVCDEILHKESEIYCKEPFISMLKIKLPSIIFFLTERTVTRNLDSLTPANRRFTLMKDFYKEKIKIIDITFMRGQKSAQKNFIRQEIRAHLKRFRSEINLMRYKRAVRLKYLKNLSMETCDRGITMTF